MYNRPSMFQGRNGSDQLSVFLVGVALVLVIVYPFFPLKYVQALLCILALALCGFSLFRMLSTNTAKRRRENDTFLSFFKGKKGNSKGAEDVNFREANADTKNEKRRKREEAKQAQKAEKERKEALKQEEKAKKEARKESEKTHAYFNCPKCNTELRVPKGKGKIMITCPKCGEKFVEKT